MLTSDLYTYICVHIHRHINTHTSTHPHVHIHVYTHTYTQAYRYTNNFNMKEELSLLYHWFSIPCDFVLVQGHVSFSS